MLALGVARLGGWEILSEVFQNTFTLNANDDRIDSDGGNDA